MRVAIVGSRDFPFGYASSARGTVREVVRNLPPETVIVSGGARGVDLWAAEFAVFYGLQTELHLPDWSKGRGAGYARNALIVADCDRVIAIWDGKSKGTAHTVSLARRAGKPVEVVVIGPQNAEKAPTPARE